MRAYSLVYISFGEGLGDRRGGREHHNVLYKLFTMSVWIYILV